MPLYDLQLALGETDDGVWLHLPGAGREQLLALAGREQPIVLVSLHASSPVGDLGHPGEVPFASETTLRELLETIGDELGDAAHVHELVIGLGGGVRVQLHEERSLRLEAVQDEALAACLALVAVVPAGRLLALFEQLRDEALTGRALRVRIEAASMTIEDGVVRTGPRDRRQAPDRGLVSRRQRFPTGRG